MIKMWLKSKFDEVEAPVIRKKKSSFRLFVYFFISLIFVASVISAIFIISALQDMPSIEKIKHFQDNLTTRIYSKDGHLLNDYSSENRIFIAIDEVPEKVKQAFISAEDSNFYHHNGVDFMGILKAIYKNIIFKITGSGKLVGASTITQQVVKNILLTNERTLSRKIKEIIISLEISRYLSKKEILEIYLNHIYFGSSAYGVYAASKEYFNKPLKEITVYEAALLAAMPKAPSDLNPRRNPDRAIARRDWVMLQMLKNNYISQNEYTLFKAFPLQIAKKEMKKDYQSIGANAFSDLVKSDISQKYGSDEFFSKGFFVQTTMDYDVQKAFYESVRRGILNYDKRMGFRGVLSTIETGENTCKNLQSFIDKAEIQDDVLRYAVVLESDEDKITIMDENCDTNVIPSVYVRWTKESPLSFKNGDIIVYELGKRLKLSQMPKANAGLIVMDAENGSVLAMVGDFYNRPNAFNRAVQAKRQLGSGVKPFVYLSALENGFALNSIIVDEELKLSDEWQPRNASRDFLGSITLRTAFERSRNVPTVRISEILGINKIIDKFKQFNLNAEPIEQDLTTALGSFPVTVKRVAEAFSVFPNKGRKLQSEYIEKIQNSEGKTLFSKDGICGDECFDESNPPLEFEDKQYGEPIISEDHAFQVLSMLEGVVQRGTARRMLPVSQFGLGGKTGTSSNYKDSWFIALTNKLIVVLYVGKDNSHTLGKSQYGSVLALPIVRNAMKKIIHKYPITDFIPPNSLEQVIIDYHTGKLPNLQTKTQIIEYFTEDDEKPRRTSNSRIRKEQDINRNSNLDISNGIY